MCYFTTLKGIMDITVNNKKIKKIQRKVQKVKKKELIK